jgi:hypothetical protein
MFSPSAALIATELSSWPHLAVLAGHVRRVLLGAAKARQTSLIAAVPDLNATPLREHAETAYGNVLTALERGPRGPSEQAVVAALLAHGIAAEPPSSEQGWDDLGAELVWLGANSPFVAFDALEALLGSNSGRLMTALGALAQESELNRCGRGEALVAAAALAASRSEAAREAASRVVLSSSDPLVKAACGGGTRSGRDEGSPVRSDARDPSEPRLMGELRAVPLGPVLTTLFALTGVLLLWRGVALFARWAFGLQRPAEVRLTHRGLELALSARLLGRVLYERQLVVPLHQIVRVTREVRYARLGLYAGLMALAFGTYFGVGLLVDGIRVPGSSPPLLGLGVLLVLLGLGLDFSLTRLSDAARGRCRLVLVPRRGRAFCLGGLDLHETDQMLARIVELAVPPSERAVAGEPKLVERTVSGEPTMAGERAVAEAKD